MRSNLVVRGRSLRVDAGGLVYHVLKRSVGRRKIFHRVRDHEDFEQVLAHAVARSAGKVQLLSYCVMSNHRHLVLRTRKDGVLSPFMKWLTLTHTHRWQVSHNRVGDGPVYQGRFKSFAIQADEHLLKVCRYVERNAARAGLVERAEDWRWSSVWRWRQREHEDQFDPPMVLSDWPVRGGRPRGWLRTVNTPIKVADLEAMRIAAQRGRPYGSEAWVKKMTRRYDLASTFRPRGRPKKEQDS